MFLFSSIFVGFPFNYNSFAFKVENEFCRGVFFVKSYKKKFLRNVKS